MAITNAIAAIAASAQIDYTNGAHGDYYFCTGTLREDAAPTYDTNAIVAGGTALSAGAAFSKRIRGEEGVIVCFLGDGAAYECPRIRCGR